MNDPRAYYTALAADRRELAAGLQGRYDRLALLRLLGFFVAVGVLILAWSHGFPAGVLATVLILPLGIFAVRRHLDIQRRATEAQVQYELAEGELRALDHDFSHYPDGIAYLRPDHPYAVDLDIFGPHSLYQFVNRTVTAPGAQRLADHLTVPADLATARERRGAGEALRDAPAWCLRFRTAGDGLNDDPGNVRKLLQWVERPALTSGADVRIMRWLIPLLAAGGLWWCLTQEPWQAGLLAFVPAVVMLRRYHAVSAAEHAYTASAGAMLGTYAELLGLIEAREPDRIPGAASAVRKLGYAVAQLDVRYNPFVFLLEITGLWSLQWLYRLDRWRARYRNDLPGWLELLAETDALMSWGTLRFNRPAWTEAEVTDDPVLEGRELGHPLLRPATRVTNDIEIATDGHIHLVTGSNMAGKSTWLRTVAINVVLARAGAPVCGRHLRSAALQIWT